MFSVSTYVAQQYINEPSSSSRDLMESFASTLLYLNTSQLLCIMTMCLIGIRIGKFHRHEIIKCSSLLDTLLLTCLIATGIFATQYEDRERIIFTYVRAWCWRILIISSNTSSITVLLTRTYWSRMYNNTQRPTLDHGTWYF